MTAFLSLFSGIGGFDLGAYWAGLRFDEHYFSEVDSYATDVFQRRFPDAIPLGDVRKIDGNKIEKKEFIITGGFPCQPFSTASHGRKIAIDLWPEMFRIIKELHPKVVIAENVNYSVIANSVRNCREIGYIAHPYFIPSPVVGSGHNRERFWMVAHTDSYSESWCEKYEEMAELQSVPEMGAVDPRTLGGHDGVSHKMDRLKCLGNAIVPQIAYLIFSQPIFDEWRQPAPTEGKGETNGKI